MGGFQSSSDQLPKRLKKLMKLTITDIQVAEETLRMAYIGAFKFRLVARDINYKGTKLSTSLADIYY